MAEPEKKTAAIPTANNVPEWTVGDLSGALKRTVEDAFGHVRVRGEISGYRGPVGSGHVYFALKDDTAKIDAVIWKGVFARLKIRPEEGLEVIATGKITTFPGKSSYQIIIDQIELAGLGALMAMLEERRKRLAAEGLFDAARKQLLPVLPRTIGVITSPTGAVIRDILHRLADRFPRHVLVWPVRVQGETSAAEVAAAINGFNALPENGRIPRPDVIIVARGGGSLEDLMGFNDEAVARAAAASLIPLVSAVGHETDWTLLDHVADWRAPTPTAAAEKVVPVRAELMQRIADLSRRHAITLRRALDQRRNDLRSAARALPRAEDLTAGARQRLDIAVTRLGPALAANARVQRRDLERLGQRLASQAPRARLASARGKLDELGKRLAVSRGTMARAETLAIARQHERLATLQLQLARAMARRMEERHRQLVSVWKLAGSLNPKAVLGRGYALVRDGTGQLVRTPERLAAGMALSIEVEKGEFKVQVAGEATMPTPPSPPRRARAADPGQGSLL
jgi:exodeoxyribonuclease VII large subunit